MEQARALSSCFNNVVIPWSNLSVPSNDGEQGVGRVFQETGYGLTGIAGESRSGDPNSQYIRVAAGGGTNSIVLPPGTVEGVGEQLVGNSAFPILGSDPPITASAKTPFKPTVPCETQQVPDLRSGGPGPAPRQAHAAGTGSVLHGPLGDGELAQLSRRYAQIYEDQMQAQGRMAVGNFIGGKKEMAGVVQRLRAYDQHDLPLYVLALHDLTGLGEAQIRTALKAGSG
jgi:hypothetical protein